MIGAIGLLAGGGARLTLILIGLALVLCAVVLLAYAWFLISRRRKKSESLQSDLASKSLRGGSSGAAEEIGKREDLRQKFLKGVADYKRAGFELYAMPWFLIMGEPGSGKTLALKKSNIGFLPDLTDEFQGGAGTYTMDWWFTSEAVLLDTAGRFSMQSSSGSGENSELAEFLGLLRKHRRNCPINGMILVIPAESLLTDIKEDRQTVDGKKLEGIESKAKQLARTILTVQNALDVRYPIIVWITKSDMVPGFRSFFEGVSRERQHQMIGWSNPDDLDAPFRPDRLSEHMASVIEGLRERRWSLLQQQKVFGDARLIDSVDSLYAFPENFSLIIPNLQEYLYEIFVRGNTGNKRPFLRGIYFNSAISEGKEVDKVIAEAMGKSLDEYKSAGTGFKREKAYFIGDSLLKKLFVERNLVTRATKAMSSLRRRQWLIVTGIAVAVMAMVGWGWWANHQLKTQVGSEALHWQYLNAQKETGKLKIVSAGGGTYPYSGAHSLREATSVPTPDAATYLDYYSNLAGFSHKDIQISPIFKIFGTEKSLESSERQKAWRIAFKIGILRPVVEAAADKLSRLSEWQFAPEENALIAMMRWEGAVAPGSAINTKIMFDNYRTNTFLGSMIWFLTSSNAEADQFPAKHESRLNDLLKQCLENDRAINHLGELVEIKDVVSPKFPSGPVGSALAQFRGVAAASAKEIQNDLSPFSNSLGSFVQLKRNEDSLLRTLRETNADDLSDANIGAVTKYFDDLGAGYAGYQISYREAKERYLNLGTGDSPVGPALDKLFVSGQTRINGPFGRLRTEAGQLQAALPKVELYTNVEAFIESALAVSSNQLGNQIDQLRKDYVPFDQEYFLEGDMDWRSKYYQKGLMLFKTSVPNWGGSDNPLKTALGAEVSYLRELTNRPTHYWPVFLVLDDRFKQAMATTAARALAYQTNFMARKYFAHCQEYLRSNLMFPYVYSEGGVNEGMPLDRFWSMENEFESMRRTATNIFGDDVPSLLLHLQGQLDGYSKIYSALTFQTNADLSVKPLLIEVPDHAPGQEADQYLKRRGLKAASDIYSLLKLEQFGQPQYVFDKKTTWTVPLNANGFELDCAKQSLDKPAWQRLRPSQDGAWASLKILLSAEPLEREPDKRVLLLQAPDGTYFMVKLSIPGNKLPFKKEEWPVPE